MGSQIGYPISEPDGGDEESTRHKPSEQAPTGTGFTEPQPGLPQTPFHGLKNCMPLAVPLQSGGTGSAQSEEPGNAGQVPVLRAEGWPLGTQPRRHEMEAKALIQFQSLPEQVAHLELSLVLKQLTCLATWAPSWDQNVLGLHFALSVP